MNWHFIWEIFAILGLFLTGCVLFSLWFNSMEMIDQPTLGDSKELRSSLEVWVPLVLNRDKTPRGAKRFRNRARFLTSGEPIEMIPRLVGLIALDEVRWIDPAAKEFEFEKWKKGEKWQSIRRSLLKDPETKQWMNNVEEFLKNMNDEYWKNYQALITGQKIVNPVIGWKSMIEESNTCEEIFCVFKKLNMGDIADSLKEINDTIEDDPDEDPIVLDSLKKMSFFVIKYKPQNFIIGVASNGFIRLEWRLPLNGILAIEFLTSSLIRYAAIYPREQPDIEQQRSNGSLEEKNILPIIRQLISLEYYNE